MDSDQPWIVIDFGGVLTVPIKRAAAGICRDIGLDPEEMQRIFARFQDSDPSPLHQLERAEISEAQFQQSLVDQLPDRVRSYFDGRTFAQAWFQFLRPDPNALQLVHRCAGAGIPLVLFTNNVREWRPYWTRMIDLRDFRVVIDSSAVGTRKPELEIFRLLRETTGRDYEDLVLVDDSAVNCAAGRALGMQTLHWADDPQSRVEAMRILASRCGVDLDVD